MKKMIKSTSQHFPVMSGGDPSIAIQMSLFHFSGLPVESRQYEKLAMMKLRGPTNNPQNKLRERQKHNK